MTSLISVNAANPVKILTTLLLQIIHIVVFVQFLPGKEGMIYLVARQRILNVGLCQFIAKYILTWRSEQMSNSDEITAKLKEASTGLLMPSESDFAFEPFLWSGVKEPLTPEKILELTNHPQNSKVETVDLSYLFRNLAQEQEWHDEQQKENVGKYRNLVEVLESNLSDIQVFRVGEINIDIYVVGKIQSGDLAGLATKVVET